MDLREYEKTKFLMADILRAASLSIPKDRDDLRNKARELYGRLADDRFNLVVVGRFSRGKTSLINALLGSDQLPTGITPLTSVITAITYGSNLRVILKHQGRMLDQEIRIDELPKYITQQGNPGNAKKIKAAEIQLPSEILRRGFYFVDTPGLGSSIRENTETTENFLPEADAFVLVTSYESPLSEEEMQILKSSAVSGRQIFIVLNKQDSASPEDRDNVLSFMHNELGRLFDGANPPVFSVSSIEVLAAKRTNNPALLAASGITALEKELLQFLLTRKNSSFLQQMCTRLRDFLHDLSPSKDSAQLDEQLGALRRNLGDAMDPIASSPHTQEYSNLHRQQSCEICDAVSKKLWDFLCQYQYDLITSPEQREQFIAHGGFCSFHSWEYQSLASPYGICNAYHGLLDRLARELAAAAANATSQTSLTANLQRLLPSQDDCPLCRVRNDAEQNAVSNLAARLNKIRTDVSGDFPATCLPHLLMLLPRIEDEATARELLKHQSALMTRLSEDMQRYALKFDAVRRYAATQEEITVTERGLLSVAGRKRVNCLPRQDETDDACMAGPGNFSSLGQSAKSERRSP